MAREVKRAGRAGTDPDGGLRVLPRPDDQEAFSAFFSAEYPRMVRTVYLVVHDHGHAEEIAQDAFEQLLDHWETVSRYDEPAAWVRRVAIRMAVRACKRERLRSQLERRSRAGVQEVSEIVGDSDEVMVAVRTLPPNQRVAIVLHYYADRPVEEIADALGCAPATARVHLHRGRRRLAELLHEEVDDVVG